VTLFYAQFGLIKFLKDDFSAVYRLNETGTWSNRPKVSRWIQTIIQMEIIKERLGLNSSTHIDKRKIKDLTQLILKQPSSIREYLQGANIDAKFILKKSPRMIVDLCSHILFAAILKLKKLIISKH
jgi:hypothetical protein